jgi:hypothetical protein
MIKMDKKEIKKKKLEVLLRKSVLEKEIFELDKELVKLTNLEKPYVANISSYSGHFSMQFPTEDAARKKYEEYKSKKRFKNGLTYGVYLYKFEVDETKTLLEETALGRKTFTSNIINKTIKDCYLVNSEDFLIRFDEKDDALLKMKELKEMYKQKQIKLTYSKCKIDMKDPDIFDELETLEILIA